MSALQETTELGRGTPLLSARGLTKRFGAVTAIDSVDLDVYSGDVLGIIGDNGAGKSTFLSLLSGYHHPDAGKFLYRGEQVSVSSPAQTRRRLGIEMVYQDLAMAPDLAVWQNLFLGEELHRAGLVLDRRRMRARSAEVLTRMNTKIRPDDLVGALSGGERQLVAIGRGLLFDRDVILLDEPTASISITKVEDVLAMIRDLHAQGKTVLLITHRLEDVLAVCTRIAVFVTGRLVTVVDNVGLGVVDLVRLMYEDSP
ncbi:MAG: ATP-binding cassette domain-containing protein [Actinomycetota bacterium]|nr:ATP-binding cassette domain-containing protein [Actinomycetota bacterium]